MKQILQLILAGFLTAIFGCSNDDNSVESAAKQTSDHVWKAQENAYRKAQNVAPMLDEADRHQRDQLEQQGG